jgi:hypothetical protein
MGAQILNNAVDFENVEFELAPGAILNEGGTSGATSFYKAGKLSLKKGEGVFLNIAESKYDYSESFAVNLPWKNGPGPEARSENFPVDHFVKFSTPVTQAYACDKVTVLGIDGKHITEITPLGGEINQVELGTESAVKVVYQEAKDLASSKPVKQGDKQFTKMKLTGKIIVSNLKGDPVSIKITREINGEILNNGNATIETGEKPGVKILSWTVMVRGGLTEKVEYQYETLIPAE